MTVSKWEAFGSETDAQYAREFLDEQPVEVSPLIQDAADTLRQLQQIRATLATIYAREQQDHARKSHSHADETAKVVPNNKLTVVPNDLVTYESTASCSA